jgi:ABC-type multidrug transport system fused ATPase/permease subunit
LIDFTTGGLALSNSITGVLNVGRGMSLPQLSVLGEIFHEERNPADISLNPSFHDFLKLSASALWPSGHYSFCKLRINGGQQCSLRITNIGYIVLAGCRGLTAPAQRKAARIKGHAQSTGAKKADRGICLSDEFILETSGLTKEFAGFVAVSDVNLKVRRGTIHALIGPNGAGKTTCFNLLTKFLQPTRGQILYKGRTSPP